MVKDTDRKISKKEKTKTYKKAKEVKIRTIPARLYVDEKTGENYIKMAGKKIILKWTDKRPALRKEVKERPDRRGYYRGGYRGGVMGGRISEGLRPAERIYNEKSDILNERLHQYQMDIIEENKRKLDRRMAKRELYI